MNGKGDRRRPEDGARVRRNWEVALRLKRLASIGTPRCAFCGLVCLAPCDAGVVECMSCGHKQEDRR